MERTVVRQALVLIGLTLGFLLILALLLFNQAMGQITENEYFDKMTKKERVIAKTAERKYLTSRGPVQRYFGNLEVDEDDEIDASVVVMKGNADIEGEVNGDVIVIFGVIELGDEAVIDGNVVSIGGKVWRSKEARIRGDIVETSLKDIHRYYDDNDFHKEEEVDEGIDVYQVEEKLEKKMEVIERELKEKQKELERRDRELERKMREIEIRKKSESIKNYGFTEDGDEPVKFRFNRVEGLFLGLQLPPVSQWLRKNQHFAIYGHGGYGFKNKEWRYQLGLQRWLGDLNRFTVGAEAHDLTDTQDDWIISSLENSLAALLLKEDFQDFYRRDGFSLYASQNFTPVLQIHAGYHRDKFTNMENKNNWALFGNKKEFRTNPPALPIGIRQMDLGSLVGRIIIDSRNHPYHPDKGWYIDAMSEFSGQYVQSDQEFKRHILEICHYQPLGWNENLNIRLRAGSATGQLPPMYWFDLGGLATLRGYRFKELTGNRMVLGNLEYVLRTSNISNIDMLFLNELNLILFVDYGYAWFSGDENTYKQGSEPKNIMSPESPMDGFETLTFSRLKTNVGIALASEDGNFRINLAKRTDRGGEDIMVTLRISSKL